MKSASHYFTKYQQRLTHKRDEVLEDKIKSNKDKDKDLKAPLKSKGFVKWDEFTKWMDG